MISEVVMPQMGADMTEGTLLRWLKQEGDAVTRGEVIAEIETDKANVEIEAFDSGIFRKAIATEGDVVEVGAVIAVIASADEDISRYTGSTTASAPAKTAPQAAATAPAPEAAVAAAAPANGRLRASPLAKKIATQRGIDLAQVRGSGPGGRIVRRDVEEHAAPAAAAVAPAAASRQPAPAAGDVSIAPTKMRQRIAARMSQSKREAPHYYLLVDIDMTDAMAFREQMNEIAADGARVTVNDLIVRACALALQRHPAFNATITPDGAVTRHGAQHVCIAIALEDGLIAPAVVDTGSKTLIEIALASRDLSDRAKNGALRPEEVSAGTFSITNLGAYGVEALIGIIQPPQTAILGVGSVMAQPAVRDGQVAVRQIMKVALSADHRVTDGAQGAQFLSEIKRLLEHPLLLVL